MSKTTFEFKFPFEFRGQKYPSLEARRPKVRDLRSFIKEVEKDGIAAMEIVLGNLCEVEPAVISEIDTEDFAPMKKWFEDFLKPMLSE
jgi:hypothetical protein